MLLHPGDAMKTVYIETSIPSYYWETRSSPVAVAWRKTTREWWDPHRHKYDQEDEKLTSTHSDNAHRSGLAEPGPARFLERMIIERN
jgi:hypothetical protein